MNSIEDLKDVIRGSHGASAIHLSSVPVREALGDDQAWEGTVEVFMLSNHPKAKTAYAWTERSNVGDTAVRHITVLHLPPVDSPQTAVRSVMMYGPH